MKKLGMIYEGHFYHDMDHDMKNQYYQTIIEVIKPFSEHCHEIAVKLDNLTHEIDNLFYTEEWKNLEQMFEAYTEDSRVERRDFIGYILDAKSNLTSAVHKLENSNIQSELSDVLTGQKIQ